MWLYTQKYLGSSGVPMFGAHVFRAVLSSRWHEVPFFSFLTGFSLKSTSSGIRIATPAWFLVIF